MTKAKKIIKDLEHVCARGSYRSSHGEGDVLKIEVPTKTMNAVFEMLRGYDRLRNCTNCCHKNVCYTVYVRKRDKANDYSACEEWKVESDA